MTLGNPPTSYTGQSLTRGSPQAKINLWTPFNQSPGPLHSLLRQQCGHTSAAPATHPRSGTARPAIKSPAHEAE